MFEKMIYEAILQDMLNRVTSDVDKREGSIIYDALAPCAYYLADQYFRLDNFLDLLFADTAVGEYLDRCVGDMGMTRNPATYAVRKVVTSGEIPIGSIWGIKEVTYIIQKNLSQNQYRAVCGVAGVIGNQHSGALTLVSGSTSETAELTDILEAGADEESDELLRARYYNRVRLPATSGNEAHYLQWAGEVPGVGKAKVFPLWNGNGTVKVLIVDSEGKINSGLEAPVAAYIEKERPIGATVTVGSPTGKLINITAKVLLDGSQSLDNVKAAYEKRVKEYLKGLVFSSARVSYGMVGSLLIDTDGVLDYELLQLNGSSANIPIEAEEIPVFGTCNLVEVMSLGS